MRARERPGAPSRLAGEPHGVGPPDDGHPITDLGLARPGPRACRASLPFFSTTASEWVCRGVFGIGALLVLLFLVLMARRLLQRP